MNSIRERRCQTGRTQEDLAKELGIDRSTIAKWETCESLPRADMLPKLAKILNCTIDDLLNVDIDNED